MQNAKPKKRKSISYDKYGYLFVAPFFITFLVFQLYPIFFTFRTSLTDAAGWSKVLNNSIVGFDSFQKLFAFGTDVSRFFWQSLGNTAFVLVAAVVALLLSLVVSALIATNVRGAKGFKAIYFVPYVCSLVAITFMWKWIYDYNYGVLNTTLMDWGWIQEPISWLGSAEYYRTAMFVLLVWSSTGFNIILLTAALIGVPRELHEAAQIDGAGEFRRFFSITLPLISPTIFYLLIMGLIGALQEFTRFQVMTPDGGPEYQGMTVVFYLYRQLFNASGGSDLGVASAMGWIIAVLISAVSILNFSLQRRWVNYD